MQINNQYLQELYAQVEKRNAGEKEFLQAVGEVFESLSPVIEKRPDLVAAGVMDRIVEPERFIQFMLLGLTTAVRYR